MKFSKLNDQKLAQSLLLAPVSAIQHNHSTVKGAIKDMDCSEECTLEVEFVNDLFSLTTDEIVDK